EMPNPLPISCISAPVAEVVDRAPFPRASRARAVGGELGLGRNVVAAAQGGRGPPQLPRRA
ncbi:MAG TPA: hypothetical protein VGV67_08105, partial [Solirubrobacteraceae bacterium]|nr:hypothetical protein [Solirubrobacteraceae bacterium]